MEILARAVDTVPRSGLCYLLKIIKLQVMYTKPAV